ncbi:Protein MON2-like protein [Quillaja saponaria]|uniref:Protein MON2-like protein n=1 Tax=Quillaja saponaria TaxID=32244 RepID=A0AAD7LTT2_QUISA|nr:Protein MON2-like protein [Quillaja saponaria]
MASMVVFELDLRALSAEAQCLYLVVKDGAEHAIIKTTCPVPSFPLCSSINVLCATSYFSESIIPRTPNSEKKRSALDL